MPFSHGSKAALYVGGRNLTGFLSSVDLAAEHDMAEVSVLGTVDKAFIAGLKGGTMNAEGYFDGVSGAIDEVLNAALADTAGRAATYLPAGDGLGNRAWLLATHHASYSPSTPVDGPAAVSAELQGTGGPDGGVVLHVLGAETIDGNGTTYDSGIVGGTANGGAGVVQVTAFSGFTGVVLKVQHSVDGTGWADLLTFATVTAANVSEQKVVAAGTTVNRYLRATWDVTGTGSITFHVGFARR